MHKFSLEAISREQQQKAAAAPSGRAAETVYGGHEQALRQTLIAMGAGRSLSEHENPGEATILVLQGRVRLSAGAVNWEGRQGDLLVMPQARHALEAVTPAVVLLTVVKHEQTRPGAGNEQTRAGAGSGRAGGAAKDAGLSDTGLSDARPDSSADAERVPGRGATALDSPSPSESVVPTGEGHIDR